MLSKKQRLNGKDIAYLLRKGQKVYGKFLIFRVIPQYKNLSYRQASIQIPVKLDKRATMRNQLKRKALLFFEEQAQQYYNIPRPLFKVFIFVNKQALTPLKEALASKQKTRIVDLWEKSCRRDFTLFFQKVGRISGPHVRIGGNIHGGGLSRGKRRKPPHARR